MDCSSKTGILQKKYLIFIMGLKETIDQLAMANSVFWYGHVLRSEDGHVLRGALDFEVDGQRKKGGPTRTWKKQVEEESVKVDMRRKVQYAVQNGVSA